MKSIQQNKIVFQKLSDYCIFHNITSALLNITEKSTRLRIERSRILNKEKNMGIP